jgi:Cdc6-like AAA superfamily ATPase
MYIARPLHEKELKRAIQGSKHAIVSGVSGTGKSWLCKKVAKDEKWTTKFANCANASRLGSLTKEIINALIPDGAQNQVGYSQTLAGEVGIPGLKGGATTNRSYILAASDELEKSFRTARSLAGNNPLIVILDNLESIFSNKKLMQELGNILLLLDDSRYATYRVKFLLVGIPSEIREYFHCLPNLEPVSNRLTEVAPRPRKVFSVKVADDFF